MKAFCSVYLKSISFLINSSHYLPITHLEAYLYLRNCYNRIFQPTYHVTKDFKFVDLFVINSNVILSILFYACYLFCCLEILNKWILIKLIIFHWLKHLHVVSCQCGGSTTAWPATPCSVNRWTTIVMTRRIVTLQIKLL